MEQKRELFTIGHSNHSIEYFLELLQYHNVNCVIDVRSTPASSHNPQFNKETLKISLKTYDIVYMHFGEEFGARHKDEDLLNDEGILSFKKFQKTRQFQNGIERVDIGISKGYKIALMCSEGNPIECHRFSMISNFLEKEGIHVNHILKDKRIISNSDLEKVLIKKYEKQLSKPSLFVTTTSLIDLVHELNNKNIGWKPNKYNHTNQ